MAFPVRPFRSFPVLLSAVLFTGGVVSSAAAQADPGAAPQTRFDRVLSHFDFAASAVGEFDTTVNGPVQNKLAVTPNSLTEHPSSTVGAMGTIRFQKSPWVGGEFNYRWAKYNYTFTFANDPQNLLKFYTQNTANEYTVGYIAHPAHQLFGFKPFVGAGAGTVEFKPSRSSGSGLPVQARAAYYYTVGGDTPFSGDRFGLRLGFRQVFYLAPDFGQNYLYIKKLAISSQPTVGFYVHF
ncbi:hypothetical protein [Terriglobus aquaticus]|uniref:Outer membrane protein beta-barrel domain-containing protein n=1 Tax=Terriglobus aquaticus TaxID=940139 RepID=A0ABW9KKE0_9BACT|nr:hypothetical protein [Terriglobus aquaticus]